jgi:hypothetical protein
MLRGFVIPGSMILINTAGLGYMYMNDESKKHKILSKSEESKISSKCVQYHMYSDSLAKLQYDKNVSFLNRVTAGELRKSIDKRHLRECVEPEFKNTPVR